MSRCFCAVTHDPEGRRERWQLLWFTRGLTTPRYARRRHWRGTSGGWSRWYAAHRLRRRSSCQDRFPRIDEDTKGSVGLFALNEWLLSWCKEQKLLFVKNWNLFWERPRLFRADGLHPSSRGGTPVGQHLQDATLHMTSKPILKFSTMMFFVLPT